jgi:hypothetical protein
MTIMGDPGAKSVRGAHWRLQRIGRKFFEQAFGGYYAFLSI